MSCCTNILNASVELTRPVSFLGCTTSMQALSPSGHTVGRESQSHLTCGQCSTECSNSEELTQHNLLWHSDLIGPRHPEVGRIPERSLRRKKLGSTLSRATKQSGVAVGVGSLQVSEEDLPVTFMRTSEEGHSDSSGRAVNPSGRTSDSEAAGHEMVQFGKHCCPICQKTFLYSFNLRRHLNTHTNFFQHRCFICGRGFHRSDFMLRHVRTVHKNIVGSDVQAH